MTTNVGFGDAGEDLVMEREDEEEWAEEGQLPGYIFMCSRRTKPECYMYRVFGLPIGKMEVLLKIKPGTRLFLFDFEMRLLYGVYVAASDGGLGLEPGAFGGRFPAQVKFDIFKECLPLPEINFKNAIKENYQGSARFKQELSYGQVRELISLFRPLSDRSLTSDQDLVKPLADARHLSLEPPISLGQRFSDQTLDHREPASGFPNPLHLSQLASKFLTPKYDAASIGGQLATQPLHRQYEQADFVYSRPGYLESYQSHGYSRSGTHHGLGEPVVPSKVSSNGSYRQNLLSLPSNPPMPSSSRGAAYWAAVAASSEDSYGSSAPQVKPSENAELGAYQSSIYPTIVFHGGLNQQPLSSGHEPSVAQERPLYATEAGVIKEPVSHHATAYSTAVHHDGRNHLIPGSSLNVKSHELSGASGYSKHDVAASHHIPALVSADTGANDKPLVVARIHQAYATPAYSMGASVNHGAYHVATSASQTVEGNIQMQYATSEAGAHYGAPAPDGSYHWPHTSHWAQSRGYSGSEAVNWGQAQAYASSDTAYWAQHQGHYSSQGDQWTQAQAYYSSYQQPALPSNQGAPVPVDQATHGYWGVTAPGYSAQADQSQPVTVAVQGSGYGATTSTARNMVCWPGAGYGVSG